MILRKLLSAAALLLAIAAPAAAQPRVDCAPPAEAAALSAPLPHVTDAVAQGARLRIVAIGSSSTAGAGASAPERSYPARLAHHLKTLFPRLPVEVLNKGVNGETTAQMLARFSDDVFALAPDLVIWQAGANTVLRDGNYEGVDREVRDGVEMLREAGIDVILMDTQYAPAVLARPRHDEMTARLQRIAAEERIGLFRRFALMRWLVETRHAGMADLIGPDGIHHTDAGYDCVARALAQGIEGAVRVVSAVRPGG